MKLLKNIKTDKNMNVVKVQVIFDIYKYKNTYVGGFMHSGYEICC